MVEALTYEWRSRSDLSFRSADAHKLSAQSGLAGKDFLNRNDRHIQIVRRHADDEASLS